MKIIYSFLLIFFCLNAFAQVEPFLQKQTLKCSKYGTKLLYVNGQENEEEHYDKAKDALKELNETISLSTYLDRHNTLPPNLIIDGVFNKTLGKVGYDENGDGGVGLLDFMESGALILQTSFGYDQNKAWQTVYAAIYGLKLADILGVNIDPRILQVTQGFQKEVIISNLSEIENEVKLLARKAILDTVKSTEPKKLIIVSHSQGNLFSNKIVDDLIDDGLLGNEELGIMGNAQVATPADHIVLQKSNHITNHLDQILKVTYFPFYDPLPSNFPEDHSYFPPLGLEGYDSENHHGFLSAYLFGAGTQDNFDLKVKTIQNWIDVAGMLKSTCGEPPVAQFAPPKSRAYAPINPDPMTYDFDASPSYDLDEQDPLSTNPFPEPPDFDILSFTWVIDGVTMASVSMPNYSHIFETEGPHKVKLVVIDREGNKDEADEQTINVVNLAPVPSFTATVDGFKVNFNATASSDDGRIKSYSWDFGDGIENGMVVEHTFLPGTYPVTLTVTDNNDKSSVMMQMVEIKTQPPVANFTFDQQALVVNFDGTSSKDSDGEIVNYKWVFGDNSFGSGETPSHTYVNPGNYTVTLTVTDSGGLTNSFSQIVLVSNCVAKAIGCGGVEGSRHINSDFSCGGFVANTASVSGSWTMEENTNVCGNSNLTGAGSLGGNSFVKNAQINFNGTIFNSTINNAIIDGEGAIYQTTVNANLSGAGYNDIFMGGNISVYESTINASVTATNYMVIEYSTIDAPLSGRIIWVIFNNIQVY